MSDLTTYMTTDHRRCDEIFAALENSVGEADWNTVSGELERFLQAMERHFQIEEEILFPAFEHATGMTTGPTQIMRSEHQQMRGLFAELRESCARQDGDDLLGLTETLLLVMQQHNLKEEQVLYPMTDQAVGGDAGALLQRIQAVP